MKNKAEEKIKAYIDNLEKSTRVLNKDKVAVHNSEQLENFIIELKPLLKELKEKTLIASLSKAIYDYNIALNEYNKRNGTNYQGVGNSFRKAGVKNIENKFSIGTCFQY
jgi:hypothetical protein